jgi:proteic killer suppression protein
VESFKHKDIEAFWLDPINNIPKRVPPELRKTLYRKLQILDAAAQLSDLRIPSGNRLEKLSGDREGQHSIRVNQQWRLCFIWENGRVLGVEFDDYH